MRATKHMTTKQTKANWLTVDTRDVLVADKTRGLLLFGEPITEIELDNLRAEALSIKSFRIWRIFQETLKQEAIEQGLVNADKWEMTLSAKMMLHSLGIMASIVRVLEVYKVPTIKKK